MQQTVSKAKEGVKDIAMEKEHCTLACELSVYFNLFQTIFSLDRLFSIISLSYTIQVGNKLSTFSFPFHSWVRADDIRSVLLSSV